MIKYAFITKDSIPATYSPSGRPIPRILSHVWPRSDELQEENRRASG